MRDSSLWVSDSRSHVVVGEGVIVAHTAGDGWWLLADLMTALFPHGLSMPCTAFSMVAEGKCGCCQENQMEALST